MICFVIVICRASYFLQKISSALVGHFSFIFYSLLRPPRRKNFFITDYKILSNSQVFVLHRTFEQLNILGEVSRVSLSPQIFFHMKSYFGLNLLKKSSYIILHFWHILLSFLLFMGLLLFFLSWLYHIFTFSQNHSAKFKILNYLFISQKVKHQFKD